MYCDNIFIMSEGGSAQFDKNANSQQRLLDRVPALRPSKIGDITDRMGILLILPNRQYNGVVKLWYERYEYDLKSEFATIVSYIESTGSPVNKDPLQGVSTAFTMAAIINRASELCGKPILHKVLANKRSAPLFERLKEWGIYQYSDSLGSPSISPVIAESIFNQVYYSCLFPNKIIGEKFRKYIIEDASKKLVEKYPTPIRLLRYRVAQTIKDIKERENSVLS